MRIKYFMPRWGNETKPLDEFFISVKEAGYDGVEMTIPSDKGQKAKLNELLEKSGLQLVAQHASQSPKCPVDEYIFEMKKELHQLAALQPLFINSHTGKDYYTYEENCKIIEEVESISKEINVHIYHETHRGRALYSAPVSFLYFNCFSEMRITADFLHWCCVSDNHEYALNESILRSYHIHARIGFEQGPQVNHPFAPENRGIVQKHIEWWQKIIDTRKKSNPEHLTITTELGPAPYQMSLPYTKQPLIDIWETNNKMKDYLKEVFKS
jgi:hypothetical protein